MRDAVAVARVKLDESIIVLKNKCTCDVDASSLSRPLDNAAQIVDLWLSGNACATPSELVKSHLTSLTVQSMTWCIDCLSSELSALVDEQQNGVTEKNTMKESLKELRNTLESTLQVGQLFVEKTDSEGDQSGIVACYNHVGGDVQAEDITDMKELATLVLAHVKRLSWVTECGCAEITGLKAQVENFESIVKTSQASKDALHKKFNATKVFTITNLKNPLFSALQRFPFSVQWYVPRACKHTDIGFLINSTPAVIN